MPKGLKKNFPWYAKVEDVMVLGQVDLARLTPKTFNTFIKDKHGPEADKKDYIIFDMMTYGDEKMNEVGKEA